MKRFHAHVSTRSSAVEPAVPSDLASIRGLLEQAGLPHSDLASMDRVRFWVVRDDERLLGAVGLELHGTVGLLRSLVVAADARGHGIGAVLVDHLERFSGTAGLVQLVLLTQTAERFFANRGYRVVDRAAAPAEVLGSPEFQSLCPASAVCMTKALAWPA
jgi:amino-acid N-acetyltransferase